MINPFEMFAAKANAEAARAQAEREKARAFTYMGVNGVYNTYGSDGTQTLTVTENGVVHTVRITQDVRSVWFKGRKVY